MVTHAEPSVYGTKNSASHASQKTLYVLKRKLAQLKERVDGLTSIVEGLNATVHTLEKKQLTTANISKKENTKELLQDLGIMIDDINSKYVSKEELQRILASKNIMVPKKNKKTKKETSVKKNVATKSAEKLYSEGVRLFVKKRYDEANKKFTITDTKGYKPAASNYYLGEIAYYTKQYEDAIFYFKKSAGLYAKASYIDTLLLHTAIALEKTGDKAQAKAFYNNIVENYAGKKTAEIAKNKLKKLKENK